jgi:hypothetical protein
MQIFQKDQEGQVFLLKEKLHVGKAGLVFKAVSDINQVVSKMLG